MHALAQVFDHDAEARRQQLSASERLAYHQHVSGKFGVEISAHRIIDGSSQEVHIESGARALCHAVLLTGAASHQDVTSPPPL